ncbi:MAG TPA: hypothetical protein VFO98_15940 [Marmoricola sp.]|jgi:hypothetical protein|nr:hypothetical protein [Marmoricola sp.]
MFVRRTVQACLLAVVLGLSVVAPSSAAFVPVDPYADYVPQATCRPWAKPGTAFLSHWIVRRHGGGWGGISRPCNVGGTSEHKEGRAFDWTLNAANARDRARARAFLDLVLRTDGRGNHAALARRMGIMYIIWNDRIYGAYDHFRARPYLHSGCRTLARCSKTLRHRDHLHISLSWRGARGNTSWYAGRMPR